MKLNVAKQSIFVVDDDPAVLRTMDRLLGPLGCWTICFENASRCLEALKQDDCDLLITDLRMPGLDGMALLTQARRIVPWIPVIIMTGYGDISTAIRAMKIGAVDFVEKPPERNGFLETVKTALEFSAYIHPKPGMALTPTETEVLDLVLSGLSNKQIARRLCRSVRTVEVHRGHIMRKLDVDNVVDLIKKAVAIGLLKVRQNYGNMPDTRKKRS